MMKKGYFLLYLLENCEKAFSILREVNKKLVDGMSLTSDEDVIFFGNLNRIVTDYIILRVAGLLDQNPSAISFKNKNLFPDNSKISSIENEEIIKYILKYRGCFTGHSNEKFIKKIHQQEDHFPSTPKIINSNLPEIFKRLRTLL